MRIFGGEIVTRRAFDEFLEQLGGLASMVYSFVHGSAFFPDEALDIVCRSSAGLHTRKKGRNAANHDIACRALAASFYESVATRQAAAVCAHDADHDRHISAIDSPSPTRSLPARDRTRQISL
jgi:hypothetical protein